MGSLSEQDGVNYERSREYGLPSIATDQVALSTTAAQVVAARNQRHRVVIKNIDSTITIYVGASGVTASDGFQLLAGESVALHTTAAVFAVAASGTPSAAYLEEYEA